MRRTPAEMEEAVRLHRLKDMEHNDEVSALLELLLDKNVLKETDLTGRLKKKHEKVKKLKTGGP